MRGFVLGGETGIDCLSCVRLHKYVRRKVVDPMPQQQKMIGGTMAATHNSVHLFRPLGTD